MNPSLNLGVRAHDVSSTSLEDLLDKMDILSLKHIQLAPMKSFKDNYSSIYDFSLGTMNQYQTLFGKHNFHVSVLGSYVNLSSHDENIRKEAIQTFKYNILLSKSLGARMVASETGSWTKGYTIENYTQAAYDNVISSMEEILEYAEKLGVIVAIEAGINHPIYTPQLLRKMLDTLNSPNLKIILDVANLMNPQNYHNQTAIIQDAFSIYGDDLVAIHLKDFIYDGDWIRFVPMGEGILDIKHILQHIKKNKPGMYCLLEGTPYSNLSGSIQLLNSIYDSL